MKSRIVLCESCVRSRGIVGVWPEIAIRVVGGRCEDCEIRVCDVPGRRPSCGLPTSLRTFQYPGHASPHEHRREDEHLAETESRGAAGQVRTRL